MALFIGYATVPSNTEPWVIAVLWWGFIVSGVSFFLISLAYLARIVRRHLINRKDAMRSNYYAGFVDIGKVRAGANLRVVAKVGDYTSDTATTNSAGYYNSLEVKPPNTSYKGLPIEFYVEGKKVSKTEDYMGGGHGPNFWNLEYEPEIKDKGKQRQQEPIPLQNRKELILSIGAFVQAVKEVAANQFNQNQSQKRNPHTVNVDWIQTMSKSTRKLNDCQQDLERQVLVAGKIYGQLILKLTSFEEEQMVLRQGGHIGDGKEHTSLDYDAFRKRLDEIVGETIQNIDEVSGLAVHKEGSQTE